MTENTYDVISAISQNPVLDPFSWSLYQLTFLRAWTNKYIVSVDVGLCNENLLMKHFYGYNQLCLHVKAWKLWIPQIKVSHVPLSCGNI